MAIPWWQSAVVYQVYPRSFADASGDGVGDLRGLARHLDHLAWLGVDAVWLSPIFRSPMADYGYDVADYRDVDPLFGDPRATSITSSSELHDRGMRLAARLRAEPHVLAAPVVRREPIVDGQPPARLVRVARPGRGRRAAQQLDRRVHGQAGVDARRGHGPVLPALLPPRATRSELGEPSRSRRRCTTSLRFWLDRGIDGFRIDVVHLIGKDPALADHPEERSGLPHVMLNDAESTHGLLRRLRTLVDSYPGERVTVGEIVLSTRRVAAYYGRR